MSARIHHLPPTETGLESTDATGVLTGNTDIPVPEWVPTDVQPGTTPLPIYPAPGEPFVERRCGCDRHPCPLMTLGCLLLASAFTVYMVLGYPS